MEKHILNKHSICFGIAKTIKVADLIELRKKINEAAFEGKARNAQQDNQENVFRAASQMSQLKNDPGKLNH